MNELLWSAIIGAAGGVISVFVAQLFTRRSSKAQSRNVDADTITKLFDQIDELGEQVKQDREDIGELTKKFDSYKRDVRRYIRHLLDVLERHGIRDYLEPPAGIMDTQELKTKS